MKIEKFKNIVNIISTKIKNLIKHKKELWIYDFKLSLPALITFNKIPEGMDDIWAAAPFEMKRESKRIKKLKIALPIIIALMLFNVFMPKENINILYEFNKIIFFILIIIFFWRILVNMSKRHAYNVHEWAVTTLREPDIFIQYPIDASAVSAPWIDLNHNIVNKTKKRIGNIFK